MKYIPNAVSVRAARTLLVARKNSPALLFGAGIATGLLATVKACQATLKLEEVLEHIEKDKATAQQLVESNHERYSVESYQSDMKTLKVRTAREITKLYAPAVGLGVVSIGLLTGAHVVLTRRNVAIAAAYTVLERTFNEYRARVRKELGDDKDREFRYGVKLTEIVEETEDGHEVKTHRRVGIDGTRSGYAVLFDMTNRNWQPRPEYNRNFLMTVQTHLNDKLHAQGHVLLNDAYEALGFERTKEGCVVGWVRNGRDKEGQTVGDGYVDFGLFHPKTQEVLDFMRGDEGSVWLDFNVDGMVYDLIGN